MTAIQTCVPAVAPLRLKLFYGVGQVGAQIFRDTPAVLLPLFMTTLLGVPAWMAGLAVLLPKLWVIFCDPLVGGWSDRLQPRRGRGGFLATGAVLAALGFMALFLVTRYPSPFLAAVAVCLLFLLASTGFSAFSVPYLALAAELSADPHERTRILLYRMTFAIAGVLLGVGLAQPVVFHFGGGAHGWHVMAVLFGGVCLVSMLATALAFWRFRSPRPATPPLTLAGQLRVALANRPFRLLTLVHFIQSLGQASSYSVIGLVYLYAVRNIAILPVFVLGMSAAGLLSQPYWLRSSRRHGKLRMFVVASGLWSLITITWIFVGLAGDSRLPGGMRVEDALVLLRGVLLGVVNSGFTLLAISMLTDTISHGQRNNDRSVEGGLAGIWSAAEKLAFAAGPALGGVLLSLSGYVSSTHGPVAQSPQAILGILALYSLVPAGFCLGSLLLLRGYRQSFGEPA
ncbi:MAG TPA: MFS transporter [Novosphingobium sp.]|nr:MFS transporter [Novosphingobium sp.]